MKINLHRIHLRNFRIHEDYTFEPAESGVTAIVGSNGKGKSSIIDGFAWALYGTRPNSSMKNSSWRRIQAPPEEPSFVQVEFSLNDQEVTIKRSIVDPVKGGQQCECFMDGNLVAGPAVRDAERWIIKNIGLDEDSFLSTILVQQKHVDELVSASQAERRRLLERLTGIEAVSRAWQNAKDEAKAEKKAADLYGVDEDKLKELEAEVEKNRRDRDAAERKLKKLEERYKKIDDEGRSLRARVDEMDARASRHRELHETESKLRTELSMLEDRTRSLTERRDALKKELPRTIASGDDVQRLRTQLDGLNKTLTGLRVELAEQERAVRNKPTDADRKTLDEELSGLEKSIGSTDGDKLRADAKRLQDAIALDEAQVKQAQRSLGEFDDDSVSECPTCLQPVTDPAHVRTELDARIKTATDDSAARRKELDDVNNRIRILGDEESRARDLTTLRGEYDARDESAARAGERMIAIRADIDAAEGESASIGKTLSRVDADSVKRGEYERVSSELADVLKRSSDVDADLRRTASEIKGMGSVYSEDRLTALRRELDGKRNKRGEIGADIAATRGDVKLFESNIATTSRTVDEVRKQIDARRELLSSMEVSNGSVEVLGKFRSHMILSAIPQVTDYASDLAMKITDGKFTAIRIDGRFAISVDRSDGITETTSQLSGGEMSLVAICLRLAISVMLSGGTPSLLILDEILTAMDEDRAGEILEAMQDLSNGGQIIIVAHNEIIKSIADKVVEL